jgi:hypothetical protein
MPHVNHPGKLKDLVLVKVRKQIPRGQRPREI